MFIGHLYDPTKSPRSTARRFLFGFRGMVHKGTPSSADPIVERLRRVGRRHGARAALRVVAADRSSIRYRDLIARADLLATRLNEALKEQQGWSVGLLFDREDSIDLVVAYLACLIGGRTVMLIDPNSTPTEIGRSLDSGVIDAVLGSRELMRSLVEANEAVDPRSVDGAWSAVAGVVLAGRPMRGHSNIVRKPVDGATIALTVLVTSGTSGSPKLVKHTSSGLVSSVDTIRRAYRDFLGLSISTAVRCIKLMYRRPRAIARSGIAPRIWMTPLPICRVAGHSLMLQSLLTGGTLVVPGNVRPSQLVDIARAERATVLAMAPVTGEMFMRSLERSKKKLPYLLVIGFGSDRVRQGLVDRASATVGCVVVAGYGSTELGGGITSTSPFESTIVRDGCVGRPLRGIEVTIVDSSEQPVRCGTVGRIVCNVPFGRLGEVIGSGLEDLSLERHEPGHRSRTSLATGDAGWIDEEGRLYVVGRVDDQIVRGGNLVDPREVEQSIEAHPDVEAAAVVGIEGRTASTKIVAVVVPIEGRSMPGDLKSLVSETLSHTKSPDLFVEFGSLPLTADGKLRRAEIRKMVQEQLGRPMTKDFD